MAELGETEDPRALVPGKPEAIDDNVIAVRNRGKDMEQAGDDLKKIDSNAWKGAAGDAFRDRFTYEPARWHQAADAFEATASALERYTSTLRWAQNEAREAISLWREGEKATREAEARHESAVADADARNQTNARTGNPERIQVAPFSDPGEENRQAARDRLRRARHQLTESGDRNAETIKAHGDSAPQKSMWDDVGDFLDTTGEFLGDIAQGAWDTISGTAEFLWDISPHHLLTDPGAYGETWSQLGQTVTSAVSDPIEFGKQAIGWDYWKNGEPGRAIGQIAGGVLLGYGTGKAASTLQKTRKLRRVPDIKTNLHDYFHAGAKPKASDLGKYAEEQGWQRTQTDNGPPKYVDENGVPRMTLKSGSPRAPGSAYPHVELRDENGQRIDPKGNPVTRRDPANHTPIDWDW